MKIKLLGKSENLGEQWEVQGKTGIYIVRIFKKKGRSLCTCSCENGTKFCNEPTICSHKQEVIAKRWIRKNLNILRKLKN